MGLLWGLKYTTVKIGDINMQTDNKPPHNAPHVILYEKKQTFVPV